ncbi:helix-turn-helix transcriptional regulator [Terribacillus sp. 179-K 1B1 HS]|uniref:helix-turn-helix transcriptional regulator n=1 Tax=Terribacillus sp. 179-K 1B1 HS TaxID=3142388 RepID=UPI0039A14BE8
MTVNKKVREIRFSKGITQVHVAKKLGLSVSTYNSYELGRRKINVETLRDIAAILDEPIENFFDQDLYETKKSKQEVS